MVATLAQAVTTLFAAVYGCLWKRTLPQSWSKLGLFSYGCGALLIVVTVIVFLFAAYWDPEEMRLAVLRHVRVEVTYIDWVFWIAIIAIAIAFSAFAIAAIYHRHAEAEKVKSFIPPPGRLQRSVDGYTFIFFEEFEYLVSVPPRCKEILPLLDARWWLIIRVAAWSGPDIFFAFSAIKIAKELNGKLGVAVQMFEDDEEVADSDVPFDKRPHTPMWAFYKNNECRFKAHGLTPEDWLKNMALYLIHYN